MATANIMEQIREKITLVPSLKISRIPQRTLERFRQLSDDEFCSDYGMAIKHLLDFYDGLIPTGIEHIQLQLANVESRLNAIENKFEQESQIKMADGKVINRRE